VDARSGLYPREDDASTGKGMDGAERVTNEEWFVIKTAINLQSYKIKAPKARGIPDVVRDVLR